MKKDFKDFGRMSPEIRRHKILQCGVGERIQGAGLEEFQQRQFVECLIAHKKGAAGKVIAYLTQRGVKAGDIQAAGAEQIVLRGEQSFMKQLSGALDVNAPDLIVNPSNPYITNSGDYGKVKLSPKGVTFNAILDRTADLVDKAFQGDAEVTLEDFVAMVDKEERIVSGYGELLRASQREAAVLDAIGGNFHDAIESYQAQRALSTFMRGKQFIAGHLKRGAVKE